MSSGAEAYPPGWALFLSKILDVTTCDSDWRKLVPFGLTDPPDGWLSRKVGNVVHTFPHLQTYDEYLRSIDAEWSWQSLYDFAFRTPSTVLGDLVTPTSMVVVLILVLILRTTKSFLLPYFSGVGRRAGRATHGGEWEKNNEERIMKFGEYVFRLLFHSLISLWGVWYFHDKPWWDLGSELGGTKLLYLDHPAHPIAVGMAWYYLVQSAYNAEAMLSLVELSFVVKPQWPLLITMRSKDGQPQQLVQFQPPLMFGWSPTVRGDFREMFLHHLVANLLIIGSSYFRFTRIGSMVFLVHDISDVPVDLSKLANFLKWKKATAACFASMVLVWMVTRLTIFPFVIYRSVLTESYLLVTANGLDPIYYYCYRPFFVSLVGFIILLHLAWFLMFIRMGWLLVSRGETHDLSEHKKGEEQLPKQQRVESVRSESEDTVDGARLRNGAECTVHDKSNGEMTSNGKKEN